MRILIALALVVLCFSRSAHAAEVSPPGTSFQTGGAWNPKVDIRSDAAIVYTPDKATMDSWARRGYIVQTMGGFRTGDAYIKEHPGEGQTTKDGTILTCGPGSYYMVPTERRIQAMVDFFLQAIENGSRAVIPEEPEFFASAGYSQSFKDAWKQAYGEPWQDPASSFDARIRSEQLKGAMELKMIRSILQAAEKKDSSVRRMVAHHSPVNYHWWGITFPFDDFAKMHELQEVIGQVWTGTARTGAMYQGRLEERTFASAMLEYSSLVELYRDTGKRLWFLADPLEDNPDRTMEDYRSNYAHTLVASLMFPEVNAFELLPWPDRIYGRVPKDYATALGCVFRALGEISHLPATNEPGSDLGVLLGDSTAYQRAEPSGNDLSGLHGLALPLLYEGRKVRVAPIERVVEMGYMQSFKVLVLSYDFFKPMKPEYNTALAQWVNDGGQLVLVGGSNAYNAASQWWKKAGFTSPDEHLLSELGLQARRTQAGPASAKGPDLRFRPLWKETGNVRDLSNLRVLEIPLEPGSAGTLVRFRDSRTADGWGPMVKQISITRSGATQTIVPGQPEEEGILSVNMGSLTNPDGRFADGTSSFCYLFRPGRALERVSVTAGNQAEVDCAILTEDELKRMSQDASALFDVTAYTAESPRLRPVERSKKAGEGRITARGFRAEAGKGAVEFLGLPAEAFARSAGPILQDAVRDAFRRVGVKPEMDLLRTAQRGPFVAAHLLPSGQMNYSRRLKGQMIDLLEATLPVIDNPVVKAGESRVFRVLEASDEPRLLAASYETRIEKQDASGLTLFNRGPLDTPGAARIYVGDRRPAQVAARDAAGGKVEASFNWEAKTLYITFPGSPEGVTIEISWRGDWKEE